MRYPYSDPYYLQLLTAVVADPADDFPRQIVADWLEEQGEAERAELIRVQLELEVLRDRKDSLGREIGHRNSEKIKPLMEREKTLLYSLELSTLRGTREQHWNRWYGWAPKELQRLHDGPSSYTTWTYQRGFIETVECLTEDWNLQGEAILKQCPISTVTLEDLDAADAYLEWGEVTVTMYPNHRDGTWLNFARWKMGKKQIRFKVKSFDGNPLAWDFNQGGYHRWADQYTMVKSIGYKAGKTLAEQIERRTLNIYGTPT